MRVNYQKVGERIKLLRETKGMTLGDLESKTNFTQKSILLAEHGQAALNLDFLVQISDALGVTPNDILIGEYKAVDAAAAEKDALIKAFLAKIELLENGDAQAKPSTTKIKETGEALQDMKQMVDDTRRAAREKSSEPGAKRTPRYF